MTTERKFISYLRVSTVRQGASGLGLDAQRKAVADYLNGGRWTVIEEVVEVESGKRNDRPKLAEALRLCRVHGAVLVIAKLDRLSRDAAFLYRMRDEGVKFVAADMPEANEMVVGIMAAVAEAEGKMISTRTKAALAASKARGRKLGGDRGNLQTDGVRGRQLGTKVQQEKAQRRAVDLSGIIQEVRQGGAVTLREIAAGLNARNVPTARGGEWSATQVMRVIQRTEGQA